MHINWRASAALHQLRAIFAKFLKLQGKIGNVLLLSKRNVGLT
jgi:hypothetical protein